MFELSVQDKSIWFEVVAFATRPLGAAGVVLGVAVGVAVAVGVGVMLDAGLGLGVGVATGAEKTSCSRWTGVALNRS